MRAPPTLQTDDILPLRRRGPDAHKSSPLAATGAVSNRSPATAVTTCRPGRTESQNVVVQGVQGVQEIQVRNEMRRQMFRNCVVVILLAVVVASCGRKPAPVVKPAPPPSVAPPAVATPPPAPPTR